MAITWHFQRFYFLFYFFLQYAINYVGNSPVAFPKVQGTLSQHNTTLVLPHLAKLQQKILLLATGALPAEMFS